MAKKRIEDNKVGFNNCNSFEDQAGGSSRRSTLNGIGPGIHQKLRNAIEENYKPKYS